MGATQGRAGGTVPVKCERGAGLVEIMVVLGVAGLVAALGVEGLGGMLARSQGRAGAAELAGELRAARTHAMLRRERVRVLFEPEQSAVRVESADQPGRVLRLLSLRERQVTIEDVSNGPAILFQPSGRTATPTTVTLRNRRGARWRLTVTITGRVTIQ
jgi:type IV fimbrial biogenesis protein FimT